MKKWAVGAVIGAALLLGGCSSGGAAGTSEPAQVADQAPAASTEPTAAPITSTPSATAEATEDAYSGDELFLRAMAASWQGPIPTDTDLLGAAKLTCEQFAAGGSFESITVVEGADDAARSNNNQLTHVAVQVYCPEYTVD